MKRLVCWTLIMAMTLQTPVMVFADSSVAAASQSASGTGGLSWFSSLFQSLKSKVSGAPMGAEQAATQLMKAGATSQQAELIIANEVAKGSVQAPVQPQGFWARLSTKLKTVGSNAKISMNNVSSKLDYKNYNSVKLDSGMQVKWNQSGTESYQFVDSKGNVLHKSSSKLGGNQIKIDSNTNVEAVAQHQGALSEASFRLEAAKGQMQALKLKIDAGQAGISDFKQYQQLKKNVPKYEKAYDSLKNQTELSGKKSSIGGSAMKFALTSVGIRAGVNILSQAIQNDGKINVGQALSFVTEPKFWTGTAGSFIGSMALTTVGNMIFPGAGAIMKVLPGFLGAAAGYEIGAGNADRTNWTQLVASTAASAAAFALIGGPIGIGASILAGMVVNKLFEKDAGDELMPDIQTAQWDQLMLSEPPGSQYSDVMAAPAQDSSTVELQTSPQPAPVVVRQNVTENTGQVEAQLQQTPKAVEEVMEQMRNHYQAYLDAVKARESAKASAEYQSYSALQQKLQELRKQYNLD